MEFAHTITNSVVKSRELLQGFLNEDVLAFDLETTGLKWTVNEIHGVSLANRTSSVYIYGKEALTELRDELMAVLTTAKLVAGHNISFDMHFIFKEMGIELDEHKIADTMVMMWLLDEEASLGLKDIVQIKLHIDEDLPSYNTLLLETKKALKKKRKADVSIYDIPIEILGRYAALDARLTFDLYMVLINELDRAGFKERFFQKEMPFVHLLWEMEHSGLYVDRNILSELLGEFTIKRDEALSLWNKISGDVNAQSSPQLVEYFYTKLGYTTTRKTAKDNPSVDIVALRRLQEIDTTGSVNALLEFRSYEKMIETYLSRFDEETRLSPWLYGSFNRTGTVTGRLSATEPNLQNVPSRGDVGGKIKQVFAAPPGWSVVVADYSQLELRILAHYSKEANLVKVFNENGDPHQLTADLISVERYVAKTVNFAWVYGSWTATLASTIEKNGYPRPSNAEAESWLKAFDRAYPTLVEWKNRVIRYARKLGYVRTIDGRLRRLPDINSESWKDKGHAERQAVNSIIQGSAADIIQIAMLDIAPRLKQWGAKMIVQVHDELVFLVETIYAENVMNLAKEMMEGAGRKLNMIVPLVTEPNFGETWELAKK